MRDLGTQLQSYAELLDASTPPVQELATELGSAPPVAPAQSRSGPRPAAVALGIAASVILLVGGLMLLARGEEVSVAVISALETPGAVTARPIGAVPAISADELEAKFVSPGGVVVTDGTIHVFLSAYGDKVDATIYHATSPDGEAWNVVGETPFASAELPYGMAMIGTHSAAILPNGDWALYVEILTVEEDVTRDLPFVTVIGRATAPGPDGPWRLDPEPVVAPGSPDSWSGLRVRHPSVVVHDGVAYMAFAGVNSAEEPSIGWATSPDGATWTVTDDPILEATEEWHDGALNRPDLVRTESGWLMTYSGRSRDWRGIAASDDGRHWRTASEPIVSIALFDRAQIRVTELVALGDRVLLLVENGGARSGSELTVLEIDGL